MYALNSYEWSGCTAPLNLKLDSVTTRLLYSRWKSHRTPLNKAFGRILSWSGRLGWDRNLLSSRDANHELSDVRPVTNPPLRLRYWLQHGYTSYVYLVEQLYFNSWQIDKNVAHNETTSCLLYEGVKCSALWGNWPFNMLTRQSWRNKGYMKLYRQWFRMNGNFLLPKRNW
jgi:hypothetical protein